MGSPSSWLLYRSTTQYFYITIQTFYLLVNSKTRIWRDAMDDLNSSQWILSNTSLIDIFHSVSHCTATPNYLCVRLQSLSYITKYTNVINFTNIHIEYDPSGSCSFHYILNNDTYDTYQQLPPTNIIHLGIEFKNINALEACYIDEVSLYGDKINVDNTIDTTRIALIALCILVSCCICLVLLCWWRFRVIRRAKNPSTTSPVSPPLAASNDSSLPSSKFRKMFGLDESDGDKQKNEKEADEHPLDDHVLNASPNMPEIGQVSAANAIRSLRLTTPGATQMPPKNSMSNLDLNHAKSSHSTHHAQISAKGPLHKITQGESMQIIKEDPDKKSIQIIEETAHEVNIEPDPHNYIPEGQSMENPTAISVKRDRGTLYPTIEQEGKKDVVVVEIGFQHKPSFENRDVSLQSDESTTTLTVSQSDSNISNTPVLMAEIIGDNSKIHL